MIIKEYGIEFEDIIILFHVVLPIMDMQIKTVMSTFTKSNVKFLLRNIPSE